MNIDLSIDFSRCVDQEKCEALIGAALLGDPAFANEADETREFAICVVPQSEDDLLAQLKKTHKGNVLREIKKADKKGFESRYFNYFNRIDEIVNIHRSKEVRGGKQVSSFYMAGRSAYGPKINETLSLEKGVCEHHSVLYWGLFDPSAQSEKLIGYIRTVRLNDVIWYNMIMGHSDYLKFGLMHKMHTDLLKQLMTLDSPPKYINYGAGGVEKNPWKRRALFQNAEVRFDDLIDFNGPFAETDRGQFKNDIPAFISNGEYSRAEILVRLLRFYPSYDLKSRIKGKLKRMFAS
jgi:hypothetical protein